MEKIKRRLNKLNSMQEWDSYQPIVYLPKSISKFFVKEAGKLLDELK